MKNQIFRILFLTFVIINSLALISSSITKGNVSGEIKTNYRPLENITGWINISFDRESNESVFQSFFGTSAGASVTLGQLVKYNGIRVNCFPQDCGENLSIVGSADYKTFVLNPGESKLLGIKVVSSVPDSTIDNVRFIEFNVSSNGPDSCVRPLKIDIMNDGSFEFPGSTENLSNELCSAESLFPYGCFVASNVVDPPLALETDVEYCEQIDITAHRSFLIGANISGGGANGRFILSLEPEGGLKYPCENIIPLNGAITCNITLNEDLTTNKKAIVCIKPEIPDNYKIKYESINPCGSITYTNPYSTNPKDFEIFAYAIKYRSPQKFRMDNSSTGDSIKSVITDYIDRRYNYNCSDGCVIPIKIYSGISQSITVDGVNFGYYESGIPKNETTIGDLVSKPPLMSSSLFQKLDLVIANIKAPRNTGDYMFSLKNGNVEIFKSNISVGDAPEVLEILPHDAVALLDNTFFAVMPSSANATAIQQYEWKFGNSTPIVTTTNQVTRKFSSTGTESLTLKINTNKGSSTKTIVINIYTPDQGFGKTITNYRTSMNAFNSQLQSQGVSALFRKEVNGDKKIIDLTTLNTDLNAMEKTFNETLNTEASKKLTLMQELLALKIPSSLEVTQSITGSKFFQNPGRIDFVKLEEIGAGNASESEDISNQINTWLSQNLDITYSSKSYSVRYYSGETAFLFTDTSLNLNPKSDIETVYVVLDGDAESIKLPDSEIVTKNTMDNQAVYMELTELKQTQNIFIQFLYPQKVDFMNLPVYVVPNLDNVGISSISTGNCNNNRKCDSGETYKDCPGDCKPWGTAIVLLIILLVIAVIVYVIMQELYKRYYESYLFANKTQLFNLVNFMYNSSNQGNVKSGIMSKLKEQGWKGEQLEYAWKKFKGERIGMWEIPIFKWLENKQVKNELNKRNADSGKNPFIK
ncbi:PKD domain-containing protein [Candidatus Pacearchaeota archaeon]|nr:PKD domain-containing protein [Candidatus Pacearchaeota archaeon]